MGAVFVMILLRCVIAHLNWVVKKCGENQGDATTREGTWGKNNCKQQKRALSIDSRLWMEKIWAFYQHNSRISPDFPLTFYVSSKKPDSFHTSTEGTLGYGCALYHLPASLILTACELSDSSFLCVRDQTIKLCGKGRK